MKKNFDLECPCCGAKLTVDAKLGAIIDHEPPPERKAHMEMDLGDAARQLKEKEAQRDDVFAKSVENQRKHGDVLAAKFEEQFKKVKDKPVEKPLRDMDLD